jgi:hypothetical protein
MMVRNAPGVSIKRRLKESKARLEPTKAPKPEVLATRKLAQSLALQGLLSLLVGFDLPPPPGDDLCCPQDLRPALNNGGTVLCEIPSDLTPVLHFPYHVGAPGALDGCGGSGTLGCGKHAGAEERQRRKGRIAAQDVRCCTWGNKAC